MIQLVVAVRDAAADAFGRPFFVPSKAAAIRSFSDEVNRVDDNNAFNKHPKDFALYEIGSYDDSIGALTSVDVPVLLIQADQCFST
jgi:hypothetical protein